MMAVLLPDLFLIAEKGNAVLFEIPNGILLFDL
jgi:hypothetical protein